MLPGARLGLPTSFGASHPTGRKEERKEEKKERNKEGRIDGWMSAGLQLCRYGTNFRGDQTVSQKKK